MRCGGGMGWNDRKPLPGPRPQKTLFLVSQASERGLKHPREVSTNVRVGVLSVHILNGCMETVAFLCDDGLRRWPCFNASSHLMACVSRSCMWSYTGNTTMQSWGFHGVL